MSEISTRILEQYHEINEVLRAYPNAKLVAVSKRQNNEKIKVLVDAGHLDFGENYFQEWQEKKEIFPNNLRWHFIGGLQSRKVASLVREKIACIHSLGSSSSISKYNAQTIKPELGAFIQVNMALEAQKSGVSVDELKKLRDEGQLGNIKGLMTMPPAGSSETELREQFSSLRKLAESCELKELSMGMSSDWKIALDEGATFIRMGSTIFGQRDY